MIINFFIFLLKIKKAKNIKQKRIKRAIIMMLYCRYQAFLFDLNLISLPNDDIPQHNAQSLCVYGACATLSYLVCISGVCISGRDQALRPSRLDLRVVLKC